MCLSTVYARRGDEKDVVAKNVQEISVEGGKIRLIDFMGRETVVEGSLVRADLVGGVVEIQGVC